MQSINPEDKGLVGDLFLEAQRLSQSIPSAQAFNLVVNNGAAAGQIIFHLHIHFLAGKKLFNL
jgi:histidine triad (HIT) family protein